MSKCSRESYNDAFTFLCTQSLLLASLQMLLNLQTRKNVSESQTGIELATLWDRVKHRNLCSNQIYSLYGVAVFG